MPSRKPPQAVRDLTGNYRIDGDRLRILFTVEWLKDTHRWRMSQPAPMWPRYIYFEQEDMEHFLKAKRMFRVHTP